MNFCMDKLLVTAISLVLKVCAVLPSTEIHAHTTNLDPGFCILGAMDWDWEWDGSASGIELGRMQPSGDPDEPRVAVETEREDAQCENCQAAWIE